MKKALCFAPGTRVKMRAAWLRSVGAYTGSIPFQRGRVLSTEECRSYIGKMRASGTVHEACDLDSSRFNYVLWDGDEAPAPVLCANIAADKTLED